jgi:hypothetical protein
MPFTAEFINARAPIGPPGQDFQHRELEVHGHSSLEKLGNSRPLLIMPNRGENCRRYVTRRSPDCSTPENGHGKNIRQVPRFGLGIRLAAGRREQGMSNCANLEGTATSSSQVFERGLIDHVDWPFRAPGAAALDSQLTR